MRRVKMQSDDKAFFCNKSKQGIEGGHLIRDHQPEASLFLFPHYPTFVLDALLPPLTLRLQEKLYLTFGC